MARFISWTEACSKPWSSEVRLQAFARALGSNVSRVPKEAQWPKQLKNRPSDAKSFIGGTRDLLQVTDQAGAIQAFLKPNDEDGLVWTCWSTAPNARYNHNFGFYDLPEIFESIVRTQQSKRLFPP